MPQKFYEARFEAAFATRNHFPYLVASFKVNLDLVKRFNKYGGVLVTLGVNYKIFYGGVLVSFGVC